MADNPHVELDNNLPSPPTRGEGSIVEISTVRRLREEPPGRENLRGSFTTWLLVAFMVQIATALGVAVFKPESLDTVLRVLSVTLTPTVALLGTVSGFYFGNKPLSDRD